MTKMETDNDKLYEKLKELCKKAGCFIPEKHIVLHKEADTPLYLRYWLGLKYR